MSKNKSDSKVNNELSSKKDAESCVIENYTTPVKKISSQNNKNSIGKSSGKKKSDNKVINGLSDKKDVDSCVIENYTTPVKKASSQKNKNSIGKSPN